MSRLLAFERRVYVFVYHSGREGTAISYCIDIVTIAVATVLVAAVAVAAVAEGPVPISYRIASATATTRDGINYGIP